MHFLVMFLAIYRHQSTTITKISIVQMYSKTSTVQMYDKMCTVLMFTILMHRSITLSQSRLKKVLRVWITMDILEMAQWNIWILNSWIPGPRQSRNLGNVDIQGKDMIFGL